MFILYIPVQYTGLGGILCFYGGKGILEQPPVQGVALEPYFSSEGITHTDCFLHLTCFTPGIVPLFLLKEEKD